MPLGLVDGEIWGGLFSHRENGRQKLEGWGESFVGGMEFVGVFLWVLEVDRSDWISISECADGWFGVKRCREC